jgi:hypothetical protein
MMSIIIIIYSIINCIGTRIINQQQQQEAMGGRVGEA